MKRMLHINLFFYKIGTALKIACRATVDKLLLVNSWNKNTEFLTMLTNFTEGASKMFKNTSTILNTSTTEDPLNAAETPVSDDNREVARLVQVFMRPILIIFGTYGNAMSFYIMRRGSLKKLSTCFYMAMLAIADTRECRSILHYITGKDLCMKYQHVFMWLCWR